MSLVLALGFFSSAVNATVERLWILLSSPALDLQNAAIKNRNPKQSHWKLLYQICALVVILAVGQNGLFSFFQKIVLRVWLPKYVVTREKIILLRILLVFIFARVLRKFLLFCFLPYFFTISLFFGVGFLIGRGKSEWWGDAFCCGLVFTDLRFYC